MDAVERDITYLKDFGCRAAGCLDPAWAERGLHASNCVQAELDHATEVADFWKKLAIHALADLDYLDVPILLIKNMDVEVRREVKEFQRNQTSYS